MRNISLFLLSSVALTPVVRAQQQIINGGFEDWSFRTAFEQLDDWSTGNFTLPGVETTTKVPGHTGAFAARLETQTDGVNTAFGFILHGEFVNDIPTGGVLFTTAIDAVEGWYRYDVQPGDSAVVAVGIWSTGVFAVFDVHTIGGSQSTWTPFSFPVNQGVPIAPDSVVVAVVSSNPYTPGSTMAGSWIEVDGLTLTSTITPVPDVLPNSDLEQWTLVQTEEADDWYSLNPFLFAYGATNVTKDNQPNSGAYAVRIETLGVAGDTLPGLLTNGPINMQGGSSGVPYTDMPVALHGALRYAPAGADSAVLFAIFTNAGVVVGSAFTYFTAATPNWTPFTVPVFIGSAPDSLTITIYTGNHPGSQLWLDDLEFEFLPTAITERNMEAPRIFPNPVTEASVVALHGALLTRQEWSIVDGRGRQVQVGSYGNASQELLHVGADALPSGAYWLRLELNGTPRMLPFLKR